VRALSHHSGDSDVRIAIAEKGHWSADRGTTYYGELDHAKQRVDRFGCTTLFGEID
jgi:hypothetical protein